MHVILSTDRFGFPEVELGILPGWCGTQRLPRLAGLKLAFDLIPTGRRLKVKEAVQNGVVDKVFIYVNQSTFK